MARDKKGKKGKKTRGVDRAERIRQAKEDSKKAGQSTQSSTVKLPDGVTIYKPEEGRQVFGILPFEIQKDRGLEILDKDPGMDAWYLPFAIHRDIGPESAWVTCLRKTFGKACPVCEERAKLQSEQADWEKEIKPLMPSSRALFLVTIDDELRLLDISHHLFGKQLGIEIEDIDEEDEDKVFFIPEDSVDLRVRWVMEKIGKFTIISAGSIKFVDRKKDLDDDLVEQAFGINLSDCIIELPYNKIFALFHHVDEEDLDEDGDAGDDGDEPEDTPRRGRGRKKEEEPEDDDDGEDGGDNDEGDSDSPEEGEEADDADGDGPEGEVDLDEMDGDELIEYADENDIDIPKKMRKKAAKDDEDALEELRELILAEAEDDPEDGDDPEPEDEPEEKPGKKDKKDKKKKDKKSGKGECPEGYDFGADCDEHPECDDCPKWESCFDAKE